MAERLLLFWVFLVFSNGAKSQLDELFFKGFKGGAASNISLNGASEIEDRPKGHHTALKIGVSVSATAVIILVEAVVVLKLGLMCSNNAPKARPTMRQAVSYLEGEVALPEAVEAPDAYDRKKGGAAASEFVDYVNHSYPTSSSAGDDKDVDLESGYSSSLLSIPR
ncbi:hypothetical protein FH972_001442 [Carpinus fangiana]|uniref:Uncharacterized protein n=1 Tax=Carpinus fangiana TaxID=176857 RepID=A0A5N6QDM0_9ROSI|nr:hypothetical protein FH972_001442 [Carpinus fangiana]